jgi:hypothetical protein
MLTLKIKQDRVNDTKRTMDDELQVQKAHSQEMVATLEIQKSRELALNKEATQSTVQQSIEQNKIEERYATATANMRKEQIDNEIRAQKEFAEKFPDNFAVQEEVNKKVIELGVQRSNSEREVNQQILQSRVQLVDKLKQEADREAGLGDQLTNKAIENLKKRGRTRASIGEITEEIGRIRGRQQEALAQGMYGGQMNLAEYQAAIGDRGLWGGLTKMGTTEAGAIGQSFAQTAGAAFGQMPGTYLPSNVSMGPGGAPQFNAPNVDPIIDSYTSAFAKIPDAVDKSIERIGERIDRGWRTVEEKLSDRIEENLTRRLEFESARQ